MWTKFILQAFRSIRKQKFYSLINVIGLGISLFSVFILSLYIYHEWSFDRFHSQSDNIYRVFEENTNRTYAVTPYAWRDGLIDEFSEIKDAVRIQTFGSIFGKDGELFSENNGIAADTSLFNIFDFKLLKGDPNTALVDPNSVLLTPILSEKYFGDENPMGKLLEINLFGKKETFTVNGVIDCPDNSHIQFEYVTPFERVMANNPNAVAYDDWSVHFLFTYVLVEEGADLSGMKKKMNEFLHRHHGEELSAKYNPQLEPLTEVYLKSVREFDFQPQGSLSNLKILAAVAFAILFIGVINFINLTTARAFTKAKNSSIRKVFGSTKFQLVKQLLVESWLLLIVSIALALGTMQLVSEFVFDLSGKDLSPIHWLSLNSILALVFFWLILGIAMGVYPGLAVASFKPVQLLNTKSSNSRSQILARRILSVFQVASASMLIVGTLVMWNQVDFMGNSALGYKKDQLMVINDGGLVSANPVKFRAFKSRIQGKSFFDNMAAISSYPGTSAHWSSRYFLKGDNDASSSSITTFFSDFNYVNTIGLELAEGRDFDDSRPSDSVNFIVNEACIRYFASKDSLWAKDPFAQTLDWRYKNQKGKVIGIVKDFHFESMRNEIKPAIIVQFTPFSSALGLRVKGSDFKNIVAEIEDVWNEMHPTIPFAYAFADDTFNQTFQSDQRLGKIFILFASLSIIIAVLGLLGLAASVAHEKSKEIGIRKVIGASRRSIILLLTNQFLWIVCIANVLALPLAYIFSNMWLDDFSYRIDWPISVVFISFGLTILITVGTIFFHALRTSSLNPVNALAQE